jgi:hypothetical protein
LLPLFLTDPDISNPLVSWTALVFERLAYPIDDGAILEPLLYDLKVVIWATWFRGHMGKSRNREKAYLDECQDQDDDK